MIVKNLLGRNKLVESITDSLQKDNSSTYIFFGPKGSGKKYVMNRIVDNLEGNMRILYFMCDSLVEKTKKKNTYDITVTFEASFYLGLNLSFSKDNSSRINAVLNSLKNLSLKKKNIVICIEYFDELSSEEKDLIKTLIKNTDYLTKQLKITKINFILISNKPLQFGVAEKNIKFAEYTYDDIKDYLVVNYNAIWNTLNETNKIEKLELIYNCCGGNLYFVQLIASKVLSKDFKGSTDLNTILEEIVENQLIELKNSGVEEYNLAPGIIEDFLITCSLSLENFNKMLIEHVGDIQSSDIATSFKLSTEKNKILTSLPNLKYKFVSAQIKENIAKKLSDSSKYVKYYNYFTQFKNDEYFLRAYYLYKSLGQATGNVFNLLILAISKSMMFNDESIWERIKNTFITFESKYLVQLNYFIEAYKKFNESNYLGSINILDKIDKYLLNCIGRAEYDRLYFKNLYLNNTANFQLIHRYLESLKIVANLETNLKLNLQEMFLNRDEVILKLRIIFDIAPYVIDNLNDVTEFEKLYSFSRVLCRNEIDGESPFAEYIKNIFNRKAFLFVNSMQAETYYEEAESYFFSISNWIQLTMTLVGKAGIQIAQSRYGDAINTCDSAYEIIKTHRIKLPQQHKLKNNILISKFLEFEQGNHNFYEILSYADKTVQELLKIKNNEEKVSYVIPMNIASLYLYQNKIHDYEIIKKRLEEDMKCNDVSDINDFSVDDFYRYRFAWMEIYKNLIIGNFDKSIMIVNTLYGFVPALSHNQDVLWNKKLDSVKKLIESNVKINSYEFCNRLFNDRRPSAASLKFFYRGLPLSALQYTSLS